MSLRTNKRQGTGSGPREDERLRLFGLVAILTMTTMGSVVVAGTAQADANSPRRSGSGMCPRERSISRCLPGSPP